MSIKVRITAWITLMVLLLAAMTLVFVLVINHNAITDDPAGRLVNVVQENVKDVEFDRGKFEWDDLSMYSGGVYSQFYSTDGALLHGALPEDFDPDLAFSPNIVRTVSSGGRNYFVYDSYVDMDVTGLWVRGIISSDDRSGVMHTITVLTATLLPILLAITIGGGWLIAWSAMRPMEKILTAVDGISAGEDLSARLNMQHGPREMRRLSAAFDRMFARLEKSFDAERQFTSDASHELRTPITVILAECDRAKRKAYTRDDFLESVGVIEQQSEHMSQLVQALLGLTRMEHGTDKYPIKRMDLSALVCSCCEECPPPPGSDAEVELDIQRTIHDTCQKAGILQIRYKKPRRNTIKVLLLMDCGGSMDPYSQLCSRLFQAASRSNRFKDLKVYYFHNCVYSRLYTEPTLRPSNTVPTDWVLSNLSSEYKVILVGDAQMAPHELVTQFRYRTPDGEEHKRCGLEWLQMLKGKYPHIVWLNPGDRPTWGEYWTRTYDTIGREFPMFPLTVEGLEEAMKKLLVR